MSSPLQLLHLAVTIVSWLIIARALLSWVQPRPVNAALLLLHKITEPILFPFRRLLPPRVLGGLDVSPILAILAMQLLLRLLGT